MGKGVTIFTMHSDNTLDKFALDTILRVKCGLTSREAKHVVKIVVEGMIKHLKTHGLLDLEFGTIERIQPTNNRTIKFGRIAVYSRPRYVFKEKV